MRLRALAVVAENTFTVVICGDRTRATALVLAIVGMASLPRARIGPGHVTDDDDGQNIRSPAPRRKVMLAPI